MKRKGLIAILCLTLASTAPALLAATKIDALRIIPGDSVAVGSVNLAALRTSPLSGRIFDETDKLTTDGEAGRFLADAGFDPSKDIDAVTVAVRPRTDEKKSDVLVVAEGRFDAQRIIAALVARGAQTAGTNSGAYYLMPEGEEHAGETGAIAFPVEGFAVVGSEAAVRNALNAVARGGAGFPGTTLGSQMKRVDPAAQAWMLIDVERASRLQSENPGGRTADVFAAVKKMSYAGLWTTDTGSALKIGGVALSEDAETRGLLEDAIRGALASARLAAQEKEPDLVDILRQATVARDGDGVSFGVTVPAGFLEKMRSRDGAAAR